jgi:23S rRNA (guanosine2251-2'-O)-methyltransferase
MSIMHRPAPRKGSYFLYGNHPVSHALANPRRRILRILATAPAVQKISHLLRSEHPEPEVVDARMLEKLLQSDAIHQGVAIEVSPLEETTLEQVLSEEVKRPLVLLDQVTDPHNVGAILRSAAAFDVAAVITTARNAPEETATLSKSASGAMELVPLIHVTNLAQAMEQVKKGGYWCIGLDADAKQTAAEAKLDQKTALVLGAEGKGLRRLTAENCDMVVRLPMSGAMESLNVSNAAAIALYEIYRNG